MIDKITNLCFRTEKNENLHIMLFCYDKRSH